MNASGADKARTVGPSAKGGWVHFGIAAGLLLTATVGWAAAIRGLKLYFAKLPVPPPALVQTDNHRLTAFPTRLGPNGQYVLAVGEFPDLPEGVVTVKDDELGTLGMTAHKYNWYFMGVFRDTRAAQRNRHIRLDITYYTGLLDPVPHVPENCIVAGGGSIIPGDGGTMEVPIPALTGPWDRVSAVRTAYEIGRRQPQTSRSAQYYFFSVNGRPVDSRAKVRLMLADLRLKYCYFAKIQLAPLEPVPDISESDRICREFLQMALPDILRYLPSEADVERLKASGTPQGA